MLDNIKEEKLIGANKEKYQIQVDEPEEEKSVVVLTGKSTKRGLSIDTELSDKSPDHKYDIKHKGQKDKKFVSFKESGSITSLRSIYNSFRFVFSKRSKEAQTIIKSIYA